MEQVEGHIDGIEDGNVVGWAIAVGSEGHCTVAVVDEDGNIVAHGRASRSRPDVAVLKLGRTNIGFRLAGLDLSRPGSYRVFADGQELYNSPLVIAADQFDGRFDLQDGWIVGSVQARAKTAEPPIIQIVDQDGRIVAEGLATLAAAAGAPATFKLAITPSSFGRREVHLHAFANGASFGTHQQFDLQLIGNVEVLSADEIGGWLFAPSAPSLRFTILVSIDSAATGVAICEIDRADVRAAHPRAIAPGFFFKIPPRARPSDDRLFKVSLILEGGNDELFGGPFVLGDRAPAIEAARRIARLGLEGVVGGADAAVLRAMAQSYVSQLRSATQFASPAERAKRDDRKTRINVIIPVYRNVSVTRACVNAVLSEISSVDRVVLVNDASPDAGMSDLMWDFGRHDNVYVLSNAENRGFIAAVNRGMNFCNSGDLLLLNSDTQIFVGCLDELNAVAHSSSDIGTVTPLSSNATIFSYPHPDLVAEELHDISWEELAAVALNASRGSSIDVPTGHGFCLYIKREVLDTIGVFDEAFGRGYGEENDFCIRAADCGFRNVNAPGVIVQHLESISFLGDKRPLLQKNLAILGRRYPEYHRMILNAQKDDPLRTARWPLDRHRLHASAAAGIRFVLVVENELGGGTKRAIEDIGELVGYAGRSSLKLILSSDTALTLEYNELSIRSVFAINEELYLFKLLQSLPLDLIIIHQFLGSTVGLIEGLIELSKQVHTVFYAHDFYAICPRVMMIDALGEFCDVAEVEKCIRCVEIGGSHPGSRLHDLLPVQHRRLFNDAFQQIQRIIAPSENTAHYYRRVFSDINIKTIPHPEKAYMPVNNESVDLNQNIVLLGAISQQKGSDQLYNLVIRARLSHPHFRFKLIGFTDNDDRFKGMTNITITGRYSNEQITSLIRAANGRVALFLNIWPETYSYTLSEAIGHGLFPVVPDLGAPAQRVRASGYGVVFPSPFSASLVLDMLQRIFESPSQFAQSAETYHLFDDQSERIAQTRNVYGLST